MRRMLSDRIWERLPGATRLARRGEGPTLVAEMRSLGGPAPWDPAAVHIPVLVGVGAASREHQRRSCEQLARALPHGELVIVAGAGHGAHLSHPADLAALLRRAAHLAQLGTPEVGIGRGAEASSTPPASSTPTASLTPSVSEEGPLS